jgi:hypothetical protein
MLPKRPANHYSSQIGEGRQCIIVLQAPRARSEECGKGRVRDKGSYDSEEH